MHAVASVMRGHDILHAHRGRNRAVSELAPQQADPQPDRAILPKAASYTYFPQVKDLDDAQLLHLKGTITEDDLRNGCPIVNETLDAPSDGAGPDSEGGPQADHMPQLKASNSRRSRFRPFSSKSRDSSSEPMPHRTRAGSLKQAKETPAISPSRSISRLRRKSWVATASKVEPSAHEPLPGSIPKQEAIQAEEPSKLAADKRRPLTQEAQEHGGLVADALKAIPVQKGRTLIKKPPKRLSVLFNDGTSTDATPTDNASLVAPAIPALPISFSTDRLPTYAQNPTSPTHIPPLPRDLSSDKLKGLKSEPRKKDELWTVFRTLDGDLRKFQSKSMALKANVVRTALLPFLRMYAAHSSNHKLRPEDLDRRANILNSWWIALLELLSGRNNQSISGTDRPVILEGIAGIMERPEWRAAPSPFCALADRTETLSTKSASSSSSDFLAESVYHNVRNIFTQNLLSQMSYVVEKMSLRNAAASLVTFCGKTCAYAFCFCPGVADVLVRLWNLPVDAMKRVLSESGLARPSKLNTVSDRITASFPSTLHALKLESLPKLVRLLHRPSTPPLGTANLDWYGSWTKRWSGAESDLFYVFAKHYHILVVDFLPMEPTHIERLCAPGLVLVQAQILVNLDATINRHNTAQQSDETGVGATQVTFDDVLGGPDASANTVPIPPANATRQMAENRLIMLIRDFLSDRNSHIASARRLFAISFGSLLQAAARRVSIYDNNACYTLCDFLEEALFILVRYDQLDRQGQSLLDWTFWLSVCRQMTISQNTATEIKLFSFLYSTWHILTADEQRKRSLCIDFLLEPEFFESRFNHWCPMVRSYFMRLMCWRVARFDGDESDTETAIMQAMSDRLRTIWSHYMWLRDQAESQNTITPSTQACNPAPGRRFLIIRNDNPTMPAAQPFLSFDGVIQNPEDKSLPSAEVAHKDRPLSSVSVDSLDFPDETPTKGRWNILRSFISGAPKTTAKPRSPAPPQKSQDSTTPAPSSSHTFKGPAELEKVASFTTPTHKVYSFRFSLEWVDKRFGAYQPIRLTPPRLPLGAHLLLQSKDINIESVTPCKPDGVAVQSSRYAGRSLAEWTFISHECANFFERRKSEGVPRDRLVETPTLAVESFRRPG